MLGGGRAGVPGHDPAAAAPTPPATWRPIARGAAIVALYALIVALTHRDLWATPGQAIGGDAATSYWQDVAFAARTLRAGELPLWNPYERGGYPFAADPQAAVWAPLTWITWLLGLVSGSRGIWLQELRQLAAPILAAAGLHLFLRRRGLGHPAALLGGSVLAAGALAQRTITMATYWPWAYLGLVLAAIDAAVVRPDRRRGRWLVAALLLLATSGFPPSIFYALLIIGPYALLRGLTAPAPRRALAALALAGALAAAGALVVVVPLLEQTALSWRAERGLAYVLSNPASLADLATLVDPAAAGKTLFVGLVALAMAALALVELGGRRRRAEVLLWLSLGALGILLASAAEVPLLRLCAERLPGFGLFRIAGRYTLLTHTALAVLAAYGLDRALARGPRRRALGVGIACLIVQVIDLQRIAVSGRFVAAPDLAAGDALAAAVGDARVYNEWGLGPRGGAVYRVRDWRGRSQDPMAFARYQEAEAALAQSPALLRHFAVEWLLVGGRERIPSRPRIRRPSRIAAAVAPGVYRVRGAGPEVYWSGDPISVAAGDALAALAPIQPGTSVILDAGTLGEGELARLAAAGAGHDAVAGAVRRRSANQIEVEVDAPAAGVVVVAEVWHPGWVASIDGAPAPVLRVNHLLRGVVVDRGRQRIALTYRPRGLPWSAALYALVIAAIALPGRWRARPPGGPAPR